MRDRGATGRALITSYAAVAVAFSAAIATAQHFSLEIRAAARDITGNSAPTIAYVSAMRGTLRQLEVLVVAQVDRCSAGSCAPPPPRADELRRALRATWASYRQLPTSPGEVELWPEVEDSLARVDDGLSVTFEALRAGEAAAAARRLGATLRPSFDRLDEAVAAVAQFDRLAGQRVAARIDDLARVSLVTSVLLDALAVGLTALAAVLAIRFVRGHERALRDRADDLDQFAGRVAHDIMSPLATTSAALWAARRHPERDLAGALDKSMAVNVKIDNTAGPSNATGVVLDATFPTDQVEIASVTGCTANDTSATAKPLPCTVDTQGLGAGIIPEGTSAAVTITFTFTTDAAKAIASATTCPTGASLGNVTVTATTTTTDPTPGNNTATAALPASPPTLTSRSTTRAWTRTTPRRASSTRTRATRSRSTAP
jgi:hypothetical protein